MPESKSRPILELWDRCCLGACKHTLGCVRTPVCLHARVCLHSSPKTTSSPFPSCQWQWRQVCVHLDAQQGITLTFPALGEGSCSAQQQTLGCSGQGGGGLRGGEGSGRAESSQQLMAYSYAGILAPGATLLGACTMGPRIQRRAAPCASWCCSAR